MQGSVGENDQSTAEGGALWSSLDAPGLQFILDCMPVGAMLIDPSGCIGYVNQSIVGALQYSVTEMVGQPVEMLLPEEYRAGHKAMMLSYLAEPHQRQMGGGRNLYAQRKDGGRISIEVGLNPLALSGEPWVLVTLMDISARVHAEQMFRQSVRAAPHGVLVIDRHGRIQMVNRFLCHMFGYEESDLVGELVECLLPERYRSYHHSLRGEYTKAPSVRAMGPGRDLTALHQDGREFPVEIGLSPFEQGDGQVMVSIVDITERKRAEIELKETNTNLEEFTYVASHDLRSPLRGMADLLQWVREDLVEPPPPAVIHNLDRISIRIQRMEQLIDNLLAYARAGRKYTDYARVDLAELLDDVVELIQLPEGFTVERELALPEIYAARIPLETVLRNLLSNAVRHHDQARGIVRIKVVEENNMCHIAVSDDGPGIPEGSLERIFRLFQSLSASQRQGTGIGLSVSRRLVETHGGTIEVENNTPERGVTFHIRWPRFVRTDTHD